MSAYTDYVARMKTQLSRWGAEVDVLAAEGAKMSAETRVAYHEQIKVLRASRAAAMKTLEGMYFSSESDGTKKQAGMTATWKSMQKALAKLSADFKKAPS